jgi:hypothetical protein
MVTQTSIGERNLCSFLLNRLNPKEFPPDNRSRDSAVCKSFRRIRLNAWVDTSFSAKTSSSLLGFHPPQAALRSTQLARVIIGAAAG